MGTNQWLKVIYHLYSSSHKQKLLPEIQIIMIFAYIPLFLEVKILLY